MRVSSLSLKNYRNIALTELAPAEGVNVIYGDNAQGKTNLLESVWLFSGAKSFRGSKDAEFLSFGEKTAGAELKFFARGREQTSAIYFAEDKKSAFLNGVKQESVARLAGEFCAVVFSPDHLALVKQGAEKRRRFVDVSLCQAYPKYIRLLEGYVKTLRQRNALLKDIPREPGLADTLETWDEGLVNYGAYITHMRARYVKKLGTLAAQFYDGISSGKESFSAHYLPGAGGEELLEMSREDIRYCYAKELKAHFSADLKNGVTQKGPHRDDVEISVSGASARHFGSQGQQRSCILALKLAECGILEERNLEPPVVLLDDVMSELDKSRRDYLLNRLSGRQVFITCCDPATAAALKSGGAAFEIRNGAIV